MALTPDPTSQSRFRAPSHDTALCIIPPQSLWPAINRLRSLNDKAYAKWPPHINLVYPFVHPELVADAADTLLQLDLSSHLPSKVSITHADAFVHDKYNTLYLKPDAAAAADLRKLVNHVRSALGWKAQGGYTPHLTVGQTEDADSDTHKFLLHKARLLTPISWEGAHLAIMVRDTTPGPADGLRRMKLWRLLDVESKRLVERTLPQDEVLVVDKSDHSQTVKAYPQPTYRFNPESEDWEALDTSYLAPSSDVTTDLIVASYNVLSEFSWPPDRSRNSALIQNILSRRAEADILVLEEVSDHFLPDLLKDHHVCAKYPYSTHGPPDQPEIGPLPSLLNIAILSRFPFSWEYLPLQRRHKGAAVATFPGVSFHDPLTDSRTKPLVVAGCHLSQGLTDGALSSKKVEVLRLQRHLSERYGTHPCVIAGDFNVTTSSYAIDMAQSLSTNGRQCLSDIQDLLANAEFHDVWLATKISAGESSELALANEAVMHVYEGEQGATFNPLENKLAAKLVGGGADKRPQRYDRILFTAQLPLRPVAFNMFGKDLLTQLADDSRVHASDHWGIRCLFSQGAHPGVSPSGIFGRVKPIELTEAAPSLGRLEDVKQTLLSHGCLPTEDDESRRRQAISLLEGVLSGNDQDKPDQEGRTPVGLVLVPVGSFGLGVWMSSSDVDCLCIGTISSRVFFRVALQRLKKAADPRICVLRKVLASTGTSLELQILDITFDLHYCAATSIVERFPGVMNLPPTHPQFALPVQTLAKLKPARDMYYLLRSIPDLAKFRVAFLLIKAWAKSRGIYGARFGLLGGIHITVLLTPICKQLATLSKTVSTTDIITTFFRHYADFDWEMQVVLDPFFHKELRYHRTSREPFCLLGWHAPALNTAMAASVPTVKTIASELCKANSLLSQAGASWDDFLGPTGATASGVQDFLQGFKSYVQIDARYWGASPSGGRKFLGWLESRCVAVLVDMNRKAPALLPRMWPGRFVDAPMEDSATGSEYQGSYLIGLAWDSVESDRAKDDAKATKVALDSLLRDFETKIRSDTRYYDASSCWMAASVVNAGDVASAVLDPGYLDGLDANFDDFEDEDDSDEEEDDGDGEDEEGQPGYEEPTTSSSSRAAAKRSAGGPVKLNVPTDAKPEGMGRFRPASDVLHRLRWDRALDAADFIVGFEDRFAGAQEKPLAQWKTEQTDEEFIPQHRILYFKRRSDGRVVWERRTRVDRVFGSGVVPADDVL
ncbi:DUF455 domain protein [Cordyceps fumosorosea ARSEF 2679]|uniref:polynucleotide adenylyltransferase n=1 Tax=Cordyceps fumosorosea (strain ARSEF 2679) TaxID=1081104 RepID=A0A162LDH9_CORFA|nr:DUF455 domain protein [Cordyceps fumosorosea ARSEF 2679]OAA69074.1 DUF455 domain protein [Cordyceps fumosorosea ARSEF 2679]